MDRAAHRRRAAIEGLRIGWNWPTPILNANLRSTASRSNGWRADGFVINRVRAGACPFPGNGFQLFTEKTGTARRHPKHDGYARRAKKRDCSLIRSYKPLGISVGSSSQRTNRWEDPNKRCCIRSTSFIPFSRRSIQPTVFAQGPQDVAGLRRVRGTPQAPALFFTLAGEPQCERERIGAGKVSGRAVQPHLIFLHREVGQDEVTPLHELKLRCLQSRRTCPVQGGQDKVRVPMRMVGTSVAHGIQFSVALQPRLRRTRKTSSFRKWPVKEVFKLIGRFNSSLSLDLG